MVSENKPCPFCERIEDGKKYERLFLHECEEYIFTVAFVEHIKRNGHILKGRTTDYMQDGKGYPLNYCPVCGKKVEVEQ